MKLCIIKEQCQILLLVLWLVMGRIAFLLFLHVFFIPTLCQEPLLVLCKLGDYCMISHKRLALSHCQLLLLPMGHMKNFFLVFPCMSSSCFVPSHSTVSCAASWMLVLDDWEMMLSENSARSIAGMGTKWGQVDNRTRLSSLCVHHYRGKVTQENVDGGS